MYCTYFSQNPLRQLVLDPRVCTGFKSVWVESVVGLVLVGLKIIFNGFRLSWADGNICMGLVEVWFRFETVLSFRCYNHKDLVKSQHHTIQSYLHFLDKCEGIFKREWLRFRCYNTKEHRDSRLCPKRLICSRHSNPVAPVMQENHRLHHDCNKFTDRYILR